MFMKYGDGKIISIVKDEELTDEQKEEIKKEYEKSSSKEKSKKNGDN